MLQTTWRHDIVPLRNIPPRNVDFSSNSIPCQFFPVRHWNRKKHRNAVSIRLLEEELNIPWVWTLLFASVSTSPSAIIFTKSEWKRGQATLWSQYTYEKVSSWWFKELQIECGWNRHALSLISSGSSPLSALCLCISPDTPELTLNQHLSLVNFLLKWYSFLYW